MAIGDANRLQRCFISPSEGEAALETSGGQVSWPLRKGEGEGVNVGLVLTGSIRLVRGQLRRPNERDLLCKRVSLGAILQ